MTKCVESVRAHLEKEHKRLSDELAVKASPPVAGRADTSLFGDKTEMATQALEIQKRRILVQHTREQMAEVEHALEKIAKGTYGFCDACGETIPAARLEILPQTSYCTGCKTKRRV